MAVKALRLEETPNPEHLTEPLPSELRDLIGRRLPLTVISFDERDAARAGISNLTGVTTRTMRPASQRDLVPGQPVDHE